MNLLARILAYVVFPFVLLARRWKRWRSPPLPLEEEEPDPRVLAAASSASAHMAVTLGLMNRLGELPPLSAPTRIEPPSVTYQHRGPHLIVWSWTDGSTERYYLEFDTIATGGSPLWQRWIDADTLDLVSPEIRDECNAIVAKKQRELQDAATRKSIEALMPWRTP